MKRAIFLCLLVSGFALPAHAGHGSIRETETQIFVEYYGDASDKAEKAAPAAPAQPRQMQPSETKPAEAVAQLVQDQQAGQANVKRSAWKAQLDEAHRPENDARSVQRGQEQEARQQRQAARTTRTAGYTGSSQNEE